jgi:large subunit ribosomal protein L21
VKRLEKAIWWGLIPGLAGGYLLGRLLRPAPGERGLMGAGPAPRLAEDDLEVINGIGPVFARRLQAAGVRTFADLAGASPERLLEIVEATPGLADTDSWREQAARLAGKR